MLEYYFSFKGIGKEVWRFTQKNFSKNSFNLVHFMDFVSNLGSHTGPDSNYNLGTHTGHDSNYNCLIIVFCWLQVALYQFQVGFVTQLAPF